MLVATEAMAAEHQQQAVAAVLPVHREQVRTEQTSQVVIQAVAAVLPVHLQLQGLHLLVEKVRMAQEEVLPEAEVRLLAPVAEEGVLVVL